MEVKIEDRVIADGVGMKLVTVDGTSTPPHIGLVVDGPGRRYNDILNLQTREDDILLATYPKSGTNWMWEILSMLVRKETTYRKESKIALWLESVPSLKSIENEKSPRVLNTHLPRQWLPKKLIENGGKIIHVMRNPKDVYVSMYHHLKSGGREDMNLSTMTWDQFFDNFVMGKIKICDGWFEYEKKMSAAKKEDRSNSIYTVQYEKLKLNPKEEIEKLAKYLDINCSDDLLEEIVKKCSFENLKVAPKVPPKEYIETEQKLRQKLGGPRKIPNIFRKGIIGDWKNHFTVTQSEIFDSMFEKETEGYDLGIMYDAPL